ncbi:hypothetical protein [Frigidibacter oleivorans]|uniref:hypothetical protein n=1 Tax=Frigidibacter oleivorans TaxID=2487129 RepID=UPI000F8DBCDE|nr:hypothetical protein [Frigidibacter oleivorans]
MSDIVLTKTRIHAGRWEGVLKLPQGAAPPRIAASHLGQDLPGVEVAPIDDRPGRWRVTVPIPAEALQDGVQSFVIRDSIDDGLLAQFTIVTGVPLEDDIRAEVDLLRAELDLLKRAFRRHVAEGRG